MSRKREMPTSSEDNLKAYFNQIKKARLLTFEEELDLSRRIQAGDEDARSQLIESNLRLVVRIAKNYLTPEVSDSRPHPGGQSGSDEGSFQVRLTASRSASARTPLGGSSSRSSGPSPTRNASSGCPIGRKRSCAKSTRSTTICPRCSCGSRRSSRSRMRSAWKRRRWLPSSTPPAPLHPWIPPCPRIRAASTTSWRITRTTPTTSSCTRPCARIPFGSLRPAGKGAADPALPVLLRERKAIYTEKNR